MSKLNISKEEEPWYKDGLRFKCTGCGKCCSGSPGYVFLRDEDIDTLTKELQITKEEFIKKYTKAVGRRLSLRDDTPNYACIFLENGKYCKVYKARPLQCRAYPFWLITISSKEQWDDAAMMCEGINHPEAPLISAEDITKTAAIHAGLIPE